MKDICLLKRVEIQELEARKFGFYWEQLNQLIEQIQSECREVEEAWNKNDRTHLQEEIGDLIQATVSVAIFCDLDPQATLQQAVDKFQKRYDHVVEQVKKDGLADLHNQPFDVLMRYWNKAKENQ